MPKIMGVLTHLDMIKKAPALKRTKKTLKHRFWTEVYQGAKLFYLSGMLHGEYLRNEVKNLGRFISVMKFRPLVWRSTHPYMIGRYPLIFLLRLKEHQTYQYLFWQPTVWKMSHLPKNSE